MQNQAIYFSEEEDFSSDEDEIIENRISAGVNDENFKSDHSYPQPHETDIEFLS